MSTHACTCMHIIQNVSDKSWALSYLYADELQHFCILNKGT